MMILRIFHRTAHTRSAATARRVLQELMSMNFAQLLFVYESAEHSNRDVVGVVTREVHTFQDVLNQLCHLNIDNNEYEFLRAITLFRNTTSSSEDVANTSLCTNGGGSRNSSILMESSSGLTESSKVGSLHEDARNALHTYISSTHPSQSLRLQTLLGCCALISRVSSFTIEELIFCKTIGDINTVRLSSDMYSLRQS